MHDVHAALPPSPPPCSSCCAPGHHHDHADRQPRGQAAGHRCGWEAVQRTRISCLAGPGSLACRNRCIPTCPLPPPRSLLPLQTSCWPTCSTTPASCAPSCCTTRRARSSSACSSRCGRWQHARGGTARCGGAGAAGTSPVRSPARRLTNTLGPHCALPPSIGAAGRQRQRAAGAGETGQGRGGSGLGCPLAGCSRFASKRALFPSFFSFFPSRTQVLEMLKMLLDPETLEAGAGAPAG